MNMVTQIAFSNAKYNKSKNILTGIAIFLTTLLLFLVPTVGLDTISAQKAAVNEIYPNWHALFRNVPEDTAIKLSSHHLIEKSGLRCDLGEMADTSVENSFIYMDENAFDLYKLSLSDGRLPKAENEIVISKKLLSKLSLTAEIGDTIPLTYQVNRENGLDFAEEKDFVICGFLEDSNDDEAQKSFTSFISKSFLHEKIPEEQITYRFLFKVNTDTAKTTDQIESSINQLAEQFDIDENSVRINTDYLWANYVDPSFIPIIVIIMLVIVLAGIITIYSIYYISIGERVRELGKIKAIGATTGQLKRIILTEGLITAGIAIPVGLLIGTVLTKPIFMIMLNTQQTDNIMVDAIKNIVFEKRISLFVPWIYFLTIFVALFTVFISLLHPMKLASGISEVEAMRYRDDTKSNKSRKGYTNLSIPRLTKIHIYRNKKRSIITICSMAITGLLFMVVATVLSCADPREAANNSILGEYEISPHIEFGNKEHPELEWHEVQKHNPLTEELKEDILKIDGISSIECFLGNYVTSDAFNGEREGILGVPESEKDILEKGIIEGYVSYDELKSGDKMIVDKSILYWYPNLKVGDCIDVTVDNGDDIISKKIEIAAFGDYTFGFTDHNYLIMADEGLQSFSNYSSNMYYHIYADEKYNEDVEAKLKSLVDKYGNIDFSTWKAQYDEWNSGIALTKIGCYAFLGILGAISIMNMINTMISSVHVRKKEFGMLQAIGMSDNQLLKMLQMESAFYTIGTIIIAVGGGSAMGYPIFLWAKYKGIFNIRSFHYPIEATIIMILMLATIQFIITFVISKTIKKDSLIDRIRFNN